MKGSYTIPSWRWFRVWDDPKLTHEEKQDQARKSLRKVFEHIFSLFEEIVPESEVVALGGGAPNAVAVNRTLPMKMQYDNVKPAIVTVLQGAFGDQPFTIELPRSAVFSSMAFFVRIRNPILQRSAYFERISGGQTYSRARSIYCRFGFYSSTATGAVTPPAVADEGKMFFRFSHDSAFATGVEEWASHTPIFQAAHHTNYGTGLDVFADGAFDMLLT